MIGQLIRGNGIRGLLNYIFSEGRNKVPGRAQVVAGTMAGSNARELTREFGCIRALRPDLQKKVVYHIIFSANRGERLSGEAVAEIDAMIAKALHQDAHCSIEHSDTECCHFHYAGLAIRHDGTRAREHLREYALIERVCRQIELKYGLHVVKGPRRGEHVHSRSERRSRAPKHREKDMETAIGELSDTHRLELRIRQSLDDVENPLEWLRALERLGVGVIPNRKAGKISGLTFVEQGTGWTCKGSTLKLSASKIDTMLGGTLSTGNKQAWDAHQARALAWKALANVQPPREEDDGFTEPDGKQSMGRLPEQALRELNVDLSPAHGTRGPDQDQLADPNGRPSSRASVWTLRSGGREGDWVSQGSSGKCGLAQRFSREGGAGIEGVHRGPDITPGTSGVPVPIGGSSKASAGLERPLSGSLEPGHDGQRTIDARGGGLGCPGSPGSNWEATDYETSWAWSGGSTSSCALDGVCASGPRVGLPAVGVGIGPGEGSPDGTPITSTTEISASELSDEDLDRLFPVFFETLKFPKNIYQDLQSAAPLEGKSGQDRLAPSRAIEDQNSLSPTERTR